MVLVTLTCFQPTRPASDKTKDYGGFAHPAYTGVGYIAYRRELDRRGNKVWHTYSYPNSDRIMWDAEHGEHWKRRLSWR